MRASPATFTSQIFFSTTADPAYDQAKSVIMANIAGGDGAFHDYVFDCRNVAGWTGTLRRLRFDPLTHGRSGHRIDRPGKLRRFGRRRLSDEQESFIGTASHLRDTDGDGLNDGDEIMRRTDPSAADTDGDGFSDLAEIEAGTDPTCRDDHPRNSAVRSWQEFARGHSEGA
jgi:hypothetical protein